MFAVVESREHELKGTCIMTNRISPGLHLNRKGCIQAVMMTGTSSVESQSAAIFDLKKSNIYLFII